MKEPSIFSGYHGIYCGLFEAYAARLFADLPAVVANDINRSDYSMEVFMAYAIARFESLYLEAREEVWGQNA